MCDLNQGFDAPLQYVTEAGGSRPRLRESFEKKLFVLLPSRVFRHFVSHDDQI
jgi:hypothetical protein